MNLWTWEQVLFWNQKEKDFEFFDSIKTELEEYVEYILNRDPKVVGFSLESSSYYSTVYESNLIKKRNKNI